VQDAAYQSLLRTTRQDFHNRIAVLLENQLQNGAPIQIELLAHHATEAGRADKAVPYWLAAGQLAVSRSANLEAIAHLTRGRTLLATLHKNRQRDELELDICLSLGPALMATKGLAAEEAEVVYLRANELCRSVNKADLSFQSAWGLWLVYQQQGRIDLAQSQTLEVLSLAEQQRENVDYLLQAHHAAWTTDLFIGKIFSCRKHITEGLALYDIAKHRRHADFYGGHDPGVCAMTTGAEVICLLGYADQALRNALDALSLAKKLTHPFSLTMAKYFMAQVHQYRMESDLVRSHAIATIEMCETHGFESFRAQAMVLLGWATAADGQNEIGIAKIMEGLAVLQLTGTGMRRPYFLALLAQALAGANRIDEGLEVIAEAEVMIVSSGETRWQAETQRLKGTLMERAGASVADIEATLRNALKIAGDQEARWLQLRISTSLARLYGRQGRVIEAHDLLAPIYAEFDEGFDTPDLIAAGKLLVEEL
jgi:predicted ATPase